MDGRRSSPLPMIAYTLVITLALSFASLAGWGYALLRIHDIDAVLAAKTSPIKVTQDHLGTKVSSHVYSLGERLIPGKGRIQGYAHVRYDSASSQGKNMPYRNKTGNAKVNKEVVCYSFLADGTKRKSVYPWILNPSNIQGLSQGYLQYSLQQGIDQWNSRLASPIFGDIVIDDTIVPNLSGTDGQNTVTMGSIDIPGVIAITYTWGVFDGPIEDRIIYEADIILDQEDYTYCDASLDDTCMDAWGIIAHELGHAGGMGHASDPSCYLNTMYPTASYGETLKRTLYTGDISGIQALYGSVGTGAPPGGGGGPTDSANQLFCLLETVLLLAAVF